MARLNFKTLTVCNELSCQQSSSFQASGAYVGFDMCAECKMAAFLKICCIRNLQKAPDFKVILDYVSRSPAKGK